MYYYIKAWLGYMDITFSDILLFLLLGILIAFGIYIMIKKDLLYGLAQIILTSFSPLMVCLFIANNRNPTGPYAIKMWLKSFESFDTTDIRVVFVIMIFVVALWIFVTVKNVSLLKKK